MRSLIIFLCSVALLPAWGPRAHREVNAAAIDALDHPELAFLRQQRDWIVYLSIIPDSYRTTAEPFLKILEDPNHGWFQEQALPLMKNPPRSRYEFLLQLRDEQQRTKDRFANVRWTGTLPYASVEYYERVKAAMRRLRAARSASSADTVFLEREIATYVGFLGHYVADAAMPLHVSVHHDGWQGPNPKNYPTDPRIHGRMESRFVDLLQVQAAHFAAKIRRAERYPDPFSAVLEHVAKSFAKVEDVYRIDQRNQWSDKEDAEAVNLIHTQLASAAEVLRNLVHTAWLASAAPVDYSRSANPVSPEHPYYNPATGSAPAPRP